MARKARVEIEGGLYHTITRGNDRQEIFHSDEDHAKFLSLLSSNDPRQCYLTKATTISTTARIKITNAAILIQL